MNNSKNTLLILTGALAGVTAAFYLTSPNGKKLIENVLGKSAELKNVVQDQVHVLSQEAKQTTQNAMEAASNNLASAKETVISTTNSAKDTVISTANSAKDAVVSTAHDVAGATENKISDFQKGVDKAKEVLNKS